MKKKILVLFFIFVFFLTSGFGCKLTSKETQQAMQPVALDYWGVFDSPEDLTGLFEAYRQIHPFVTINYRKLRFAEFEDELINALAEDRGPDIFSIHSSWIKKYQNKIEPLPAQTTMAYPIEKGAIKKEVVPELRTTRSITPARIKNDFIDTVFDDVVIDNNVLGLPLGIDTLALYYNRDLLNNAGIPAPPTFWNREFQQNIKRLTKQDSRGNIIQSGIALGGGANIERSSDILAALMMQNGAKMTDAAGNINFHKSPVIYGGDYNPGIEAFRFYTDFANPAKEVYSWNADLPNSLEMFIQGKLAFMLGYTYHLPIIKTRAPKINLGIAPLPQIEGSDKKVNFANYWVQTVSKKSQHINEAWDFVQFASRAENIKAYLDKTDKSGRFVAVTVKFKSKLPKPVTLQNIKNNKELSHLTLIKQSRLSVMPIDSKSWKIILKMSSID